MRTLLRFLIKLVPYRLLQKAYMWAMPANYRDDCLAVWRKDVSFLQDPTFRSAYDRGMRSGHILAGVRSADLHIEWRVHVACWAAWHAKQLPGAFVECGVNTGILSLAICRFVDFNAIDKDFFLFDTFRGIPQEQMSFSERNERELDNAHQYEDCYDLVRRNFAEYPRARLVRGCVPDTLSEVEIGRVCFLSIDMNIALPEIQALEYFWDKLMPGSLVLLDDYGWTRHAAQKTEMDDFARRHGVMILNLPTGQGLLIKP